jgi:putative ABC transport system permease protein
MRQDEMLETEIKLAGLNLLRQRRRSMIAFGAIVVGVVGYLLAAGFIEWIFWATREAAIQTGFGHVQISAPGFRDRGASDPRKYVMTADANLRQEIAGLPGVAGIGARLLVNGVVSKGDVTVPFAGEGVEPGYESRFRTVIQVAGKRLGADDAKGVLLGKGLARALHAQVGDRVVLLVSDRSGGMHGAEATVRGIVSVQVRAYDDVAVTMPLGMAQQLLGTKGIHLWVVSLTDTALTSAFQRQLQPLLERARLQQESWLDASDFYRKTVALLSRQMDVVIGLIGLILVLGISNLLMMNTLERTGEIGTMLAIGTPRGSVLRMHVAEGVLLGLIGAVIGAATGILLAALISAVGIPMPPPPGRDTGYRAEILVSVPVVMNAIFLAVGSAAIASIFPAWRASRMPIVDALRSSR